MPMWDDSSVSLRLAFSAKNKNMHCKGDLFFCACEMTFHTAVYGCVFLFSHMIWFCTVGVFISSSLWLLGSCRDSKWSHAKCLAFMFSFFFRGGWERERRVRRNKACWSRSLALLALLPSAAWSTPQNTTAHTQWNAQHRKAWPVICWPTPELHPCLLSGNTSFSISTKPYCYQI